MFTEDELAPSRAVPVLEIAERPRREAEEVEAANWSARAPSAAAGRSIRDQAQTKTSGTAADAERAATPSTSKCTERLLVRRRGEGADRRGRRNAKRRQPTPEEIAAREAREAERRRAEAEDRARKEMSAAQDRRPPAAGRRHARRNLPARRPPHRREPLGDQAGAQGRRDARLVRADLFQAADPKKPLHELHGQYLGAIVAILTDPVSGERTGGITRTYIHQRPQDRQGEVARRRRTAWESSACRPTTRSRAACTSAKGSKRRCRACRTRG